MRGFACRSSASVAGNYKKHQGVKVEILFFLAYVVLGAVSGVMAGLLGIGGGLIIVPALLYLFSVQGVAEAVAMHTAIGTSLAAVTATAIASARAHHRRGTVEWKVWRKLAPGLIVGPIAGAYVANLLEAGTLRVFFAIFEILVAAYIAIDKKPEPRQFPGILVAGLISAGIGVVCALVGIGGGIMVVPFLVWAGLPIKNAISTSAASGLPIALAGAVAFAVLGADAEALPAGSSGFLYWPAFAGIALTSVLTAPVGARLAHAMSPKKLRHVFGVFLAALGLLMLFGF
jgi:uncharacterized membrane protein YfcA